MPSNPGTQDLAAALVEGLRGRFLTGVTRPLDFRREQLRRLRQALVHFEPALLQALESDLGKPPGEAYLSEIAFVISEIDFALRNLREWMRRRRCPAPRMAWPAKAWEQWKPQGVALIIGPWNYPLQLLLTPLVSAIAAGDCVCLKPSELAPRTSDLIRQLVDATFERDHVAIFRGGPEQTSRLLDCRFDHVFFTGSTRVGRMIMQQAAAHLTPVTLELGGKCPCIVCHDAPLPTTARRILWGKLLNAGQTCTAPDTVYVDRRIAKDLTAALVAAAGRYSIGNAPQVVSVEHAQRLAGYIKAGNVIHGGGYDVAQRRVEFTILADPPPHAAVRQEEIFGPILPVVPFDSLDQLCLELGALPSPLALYLFARDRSTQASVMERVRAGGVCLNGTVSQILGKHLPFGGVGASGMGRYHGKAGFECFSQQQSVVRRSLLVDLPFLYGPVTTPIRTLRRAARWLLCQ